jgi:RNA polymerase sigma-70 factor (ECF subfamily)
MLFFSIDMNRDNYNKELLKQQERMYRFALKLTCDENNAWDLLQDFNEKAYMSWYMFDWEQNGSLVGWFYMMMRNMFITQFRSQQAKNNNYHNRYRHAAITSRQPDVEFRLELQEVRKKLNYMPSSMQRALWRYACGMKYDEIAEVMGISVGTVKSTIHQAREKLKKLN